MNSSSVRNLIGSSNLGNSRHPKSLKYLEYLDYSEYLANTRISSCMKDLSRILFTPKLMQQINYQLENYHSEEEHIELLSLVLGRILQILEGGEVSPEVEIETQNLVAKATIPRVIERESVNFVKTMLSFLPARTEREIAFIVKLAQETPDSHTAYTMALERARPVNDKAWAELEVAQTSGIAEIEQAAKTRLELRDKQNSLIGQHIGKALAP